MTAPRERHARRFLPRRRGGVHVDDRGAIGRRIAAARTDDLAWRIHRSGLGVDLGLEGVDRPCRPGARAARVQIPGGCARPGLVERPVREDVHEGIEILRASGSRQRCPRVPDRVVDLGHADQVSVRIGARGRKHAAIGQRRRRPVPARESHVRASGPHVCERVEEQRDLESPARADLPAEHDHAPVRERRLGGAEDDAERGRHRRKGT